MTPEREAEIRRDLEKGVWGWVTHPRGENEVRLFLGKDSNDFVYSVWLPMDEGRLDQLVRRAGFARELMAEVDRLRALLPADPG